MRTMQIFIGTQLPLPELAAACGRAMGVQLKASTHDEQPVFVHETKGTRVDLQANDFLDEPGLFIEAYSHVLSIDAWSDAALDTFARQTFEQLKALRTPLMLVNELETKVDEFNPAA